MQPHSLRSSLRFRSPCIVSESGVESWSRLVWLGTVYCYPIAIVTCQLASATPHNPIKLGSPLNTIISFLLPTMQPRDHFPETPNTSGPALDSPNARVTPITTASGNDTHGTLNQHPSDERFFQIGISDSQGPRATMEDSYGFVVDFDSIRGQGLFGMFDGHGNKLAAEWCGAEFHEHLLRHVHEKPKAPIPDILRDMFDSMDDSLSELSQASATMAASGCTAVAAFLRIEDAERHQSFIPTPPCSSPDSKSRTTPVTPPASANRVLYCANVGDTRLVLCRDGRAERLTTDHKASDKSEIDRVRKADGIIFRGRVLGYLNVTRSLGNHEAHDGFSLKKYVVGTPFTSRTELNGQDEFFILACDGLWDVISDQEAVDLIRGIEDAQEASKTLLDYAFEMGTRDNVTIMVLQELARPLLFSREIRNGKDHNATLTGKREHEKGKRGKACVHISHQEEAHTKSRRHPFGLQGVH
ncbi:putative sigma factor PP2C-like phosphatases [Lyophyllum shimeji]|uniref:Sigma factor PP2C-like phosphatases n=1 Tax=Lyophyllum shimeji TaxID=47721 RepID=A0A9P3PIZ4_LYOSH|nr:putative sigma factor PP2C-like phosphatases [Lyophyllum shimeji]